MFTQNYPFWAFEETDLDNKNLFLPSGTPLNILNTRRHYDLLRTRHNRQKQRLSFQQAKELWNYEEQFRAIHENQFIQPNVTVCEEISGQQFLVGNRNKISELFTINSTCEPEVSTDPKDTIPEDRSTEKKHDSLVILRKKYIKGFDEILQRHQQQYEELIKCQKEELSVFSATVIEDKSSPTPPTSKSLTIMNKDATKGVNRQGKQREPDENKSFSKRAKLDVKTAQKKSYPPQQPAIPIPRQRASPIIMPTSSAVNKVPPSSSFNRNAPPTVATSSFTNQKVPPTVASTSSHIPPIVKEGASTPLFNANSKSKNRVVSLIDKGTLRIIKNCVVICDQNGISTAYGDPKDYDDAINGSKTRPDNPVYKRIMKGVDHLFYKTETGHVVTIGPVSKIQPLIHKFFLSM
ncbi:hypothetical protein G6F57_010858 [Rhizopus arrhizus]|uniref:Uncharacterized protein n=1 Tax=Rhizopus oryzae TaxID=64495 RepID=A0A9P7BN88_RHIOR|nr:hypothetical protein G6F21_010808 [Rhizopus arrhizus]KAG1411705.1 hypothetical protein G6F58_008417 [Rhizopus delemar]KAG0807522.1 hypothetical protein G6F20_010297 [Rhizopus arrhizus]KAG0822884.1 hypothetical protein G6F19_011125 [Rhizopus arrhizus]KAG0823851.1 hypothetical protein G6F18_011119 [Rhizopus arrhizus]